MHVEKRKWRKRAGKKKRRNGNYSGKCRVVRGESVADVDFISGKVEQVLMRRMLGQALGAKNDSRQKQKNLL